MRAIVFESPGQLALGEVPDPVPGPKEVVIKVAAVGICGTDTHVLDGEFEGTVFPLIPGHEASGTVEAVGEAVTSLVVGDHVAVNPSTTCGECEYCLTGRGNLCRNWNGLGVVASDGAAAQFLKAPVSNVFKLRPETDLYQAALIEPLACAIRGFDILPRKMGEHYLVYGAGTMGLLMAQLAPRAGAASVTIVDLNESRLQAARDVGIKNVYANADEAGREQWDVVIDCTGVIRAIEDGLPRVKAGGTFQHFGVAPAEAKTGYSPFRVYRDELNIVGTMAVLNTFGRAVEMFEAGAIKSVPMISHSFTLEDYSDALDMFRKGTGRKLQIRPNDSTSQVL
ncbi:zinc-dependent alcohol dehydrogenase family protein [Pseudarthrobacter sp. NIBRBAC000502772]|uniref:zinc-dependent alcohol dehydrogenase family protein n=1 Tax=Pseudarthrobacter sp. NIBRBAC000502772 TaxID=2590775 RepID=UPI001132485A|nr:zinc-dependent alcohol dehydrogenase family protein [Pseudarthrobacter sp. NIBRBAC000502772]QDG65277.1 zinc-dependent alcohol dehydrogenase family protein [Pseudarthrobacter sp. NIBRBAC000502772]